MAMPFGLASHSTQTEKDCALTAWEWVEGGAADAALPEEGVGRDGAHLHDRVLHVGVEVRVQ